MSTELIIDEFEEGRKEGREAGKERNKVGQRRDQLTTKSTRQTNPLTSYVSCSQGNSQRGESTRIISYTSRQATTVASQEAFIRPTDTVFKSVQIHDSGKFERVLTTGSLVRVGVAAVEAMKVPIG